LRAKNVGNLSIENSLIQNMVSINGGAISLDYVDKIYLKNVTFDSNTAINNGGAI